MKKQDEKEKIKRVDLLKKELEECQRLKKEYLEGWQRARADFLNYKKEEKERLEDFLKYAKEEFILKFLPILDNFELAEKNLKEESKKEKTIEGFLRIKKQLLDFLKSEGLEEIEAVGQEFDPNFHEAIEDVEKEGQKSGIVIEEIQKGYKLCGRLLRPAKVKVAR